MQIDKQCKGQTTLSSIYITFPRNLQLLLITIDHYFDKLSRKELGFLTRLFMQYTTYIVSLVACHSLLNTITCPVKYSGAVCLHVTMATLDLDANLTYVIFRGRWLVSEKI